jgi:peptidoglycan/xylan/chitin deacetylase (PgdA/CDA1 family)
MEVPLFWYAVVTIPYFLFLAYASLNLNLNFFTKSHIEATTDMRYIALSFDDGPDPENTPIVLDVLKKYNVEAAFFCIGRKIKEHGDLLKRIHEEGHIVANHSFAHNTLLDFLPPFLIKKDLAKTIDLIHDRIGKTSKLYRPPFGVMTPSMALAIRDLGLKTIGWNNRSYDTTVLTDDIILERIAKHLKPGGVILLHDHLPRQAQLLPKLIDMLKKKSYEIVRLDNLLELEAYEV